MPPRIFLAFSNKQDSYLEKLRDEFMFITGAAIDLKQAGKIDYESLQDADSAGLFERLAKWQEDITIFHYGGHAKSLYFDLRAGQGQVGKYGVDQLASLLKGSQLKLVFLNGCSTKGMVQEVFNNTSAGAVIATSADIEDNTASEFAKRFYDLFLGGFVGGMSLKDAFDSAIKHLPEPEGAKRCSFSLEGIGLTDNDAKTLDERCPWRLFHKDEEILNWKINPGGADAPTIEEGLRIRLNKLDEDIEGAFNAIGELKGFYALLQRFRHLDESDDQYQALLKAKKYRMLEEVEELGKKHRSIEAAREAIRQDMGQQREELDKLYKEKNKLLEVHFNQDKHSCIKKALYNINFDYQKIKVRSGMVGEPAPSRAFVLQGTAYSAHNLLIDCLSNELRIKTEVRIARIDLAPSFKSVSAPVDGETALLEQAFQQLFPGSANGKALGAEAIVRKICTASASGHVVLVFDKVYEQLLRMEKVKTSLKNLWESLKKELSAPGVEPGEGNAGTTRETFPGGQGLPVAAAAPEQGAVVAGNRPHYYKVILLINLIKGSDNSAVQGLPEDFSFLGEIPRVKPEYLLVWQNQTEGFLNFFENDYCEWFGQEGKHVLPTIEKLCKKVLGEEGRDFYNKNFSKYKYKEYRL